ncbi:hypothetical protein ALTER154_100329 [Alteromonas sp. 154]|nr:hypothetical protein ALTER154_100329 [Alteromonas sp. 154]
MVAHIANSGVGYDEVERNGSKAK